MARKQNQEPDVSTGYTIIFIFLIVIGLIVYGVYDGFIKIPFLSSNNNPESVEKTEYKMEIVKETFAPSNNSFNEIIYNTIKTTNTTMTVEAGTEEELNIYEVPIDTNAKIKDNTITKTENNFVKIMDTDYYLYAYDDGENLYIGIAKK